MKDKSLFSKVIFLIIIAICGMLLTASLAFLAGSLNTELFDFKNLKVSNMIPIFLIGGFITCVGVGIGFLCVAKSAFFKAKDYFEQKETKK